MLYLSLGGALLCPTRDGIVQSLKSLFCRKSSRDGGGCSLILLNLFCKVCVGAMF